MEGGGGEGGRGGGEGGRWSKGEAPPPAGMKIKATPWGVGHKDMIAIHKHPRVQLKITKCEN